MKDGRKKNAVIEVLIREAEKCKENFDLNLYQAAYICGISYPTMCRYRQRMNKGEKPVNQRGRKALPPMDHNKLRLEIHELKHGRKRTAGTEKLREKYRGIISRQKLNDLINEVRMEIVSGRNQYMTRIKWHCPHMVWSMDDFEYIYKEIKFYVHQMQDLTSKYKFEPLVSRQPLLGEEISGNLQKKFIQYGAPLFMKRDNGGNLNHFSVRDLLQYFKVVPLNNPGYYPQFNGSIEHAQGEAKRELDNLIWEFENPDTFPFATRQAIHNLNHKPRPVLDGEWSCFQWQMHADVCFSKTFRTEVYKTIKQLTFDIAGDVQYSDEQLVVSKSWRKAVQTWLHQNGHITMKRNGEVLPILA